MGQIRDHIRSKACTGWLVLAVLAIRDFQGARVGLPKLSRVALVPPHQGSGAGIAIKGDAWVSGWYLAATELNILKNVYSSPTKLVCC